MPACSCCGWLFVEIKISKFECGKKSHDGVSIVHGGAGGFCLGNKDGKVGVKERRFGTRILDAYLPLYLANIHNRHVDKTFGPRLQIF